MMDNFTDKDGKHPDYKTCQSAIEAMEVAPELTYNIDNFFDTVSPVLDDVVKKEFQRVNVTAANES